MRSIRSSLNALQPLIEVSIGPFGSDNCERETCVALIDTGATRTCITQRLIDRFSLQPRSKLLVASATSSPERRRAYGYSLGLFCASEANNAHTPYMLPHEFVAPAFQDNGNFDVLLGMNILSNGKLVFDPDGTFSFTFDF